MTEIITASLVAILLQNSVFERALGINVLIYSARDMKKTAVFALVITAASSLGAVGAFFLRQHFGTEKYYSIFQPLLFIIIVSVLYMASLFTIWRVSPSLFKRIRPYAHLSVFNCAVIGAMFLAPRLTDTWYAAAAYGFGTGVGFLFAGFMLRIAYSRLHSELVPKAFRGFPISMLYIGCVSLALYAFIGYSTTI
ncbi:MAG: hypothetical protein LBN40_02655 [Oscillospiraceae bacterium]|nr:hypothetical protein [Oscillospiraceae bacterium]